MSTILSRCLNCFISRPAPVIPGERILEPSRFPIVVTSFDEFDSDTGLPSRITDSFNYQHPRALPVYVNQQCYTLTGQEQMLIQYRKHVKNKSLSEKERRELKQEIERCKEEIKIKRIFQYNHAGPRDEYLYGFQPQPTVYWEGNPREFYEEAMKKPGYRISFETIDGNPFRSLARPSSSSSD